jgi:23S rRNA pseudouridine1911/1915/1917 synthase
MHVLHCDNHLIIAYKPAGVPVQADESGDLDLLSRARRWIEVEFHKPGKAFIGLVHRLDRPARGLVALARTSKGAARLSEQFRSRSVTKRYQAVVRGVPSQPQGELRDWLVSDDKGSRVVASGQGAESALLYRVAEVRQGCARLEIDLLTGRKHQIRVQLASRGWPILGDLRYGGLAVRAGGQAVEPLADRSIALLAWQLELDHPTRAERLSFEAPLPPGWPWAPDERAVLSQWLANAT